MIARFRAWVGARKQLAEEVEFQLTSAADREAVIGRLSGMLSTEQLLTAGLTSEVKELTGQLAAARLRADTAEGIAARLRSDRAYVTAARCECGGDTELYWRRRAARAEQQAEQDRVNAVAMQDEIDRLRLVAEEAERLQHLRQLERDGIAVIS